MPRARNIKPGFFVNLELGELEPIARLLFIGLWTIADREGRLRDQPKKIKIQTLPYDNANVDKLLHGLAAAGFIIRYKVGECSYIQIVNFNKHQNPHHQEKDSEIPPPEGAEIITEVILDKVEAKPDKKIKLSEYVSMTQEQHQALLDEYGEKAVKVFIRILDNYKGSSGKRYKCDYRATLNWVIDEYKKRHGHDFKHGADPTTKCPICKEKVLTKEMTAYEGYACCQKCAEEGFDVEAV